MHNGGRWREGGKECPLSNFSKNYPIKPKTKDPPGILVQKALTPWISAKISPWTLIGSTELYNKNSSMSLLIELSVLLFSPHKQTNKTFIIIFNLSRFTLYLFANYTIIYVFQLRRQLKDKM
jgi:hypothetical protein